MENLKSPAAPYISYMTKHYEDAENHYGLTKLEMASLMIAQGLVTKYNLKDPSDQDIIAKLSVQLATEVLKEANK